MKVKRIWLILAGIIAFGIGIYLGFQFINRTTESEVISGETSTNLSTELVNTIDEEGFNAKKKIIEDTIKEIENKNDDSKEDNTSDNIVETKIESNENK